ncbi:hypothetical protein KIW84_058056 [Lathyrus oleraceus]|uniref:Uncharacterized protein n=1 Tax=Pisum sativum TaxID=3888 RepID=A0A9D4X7R4_PEA|nr:hypothetical protein KIW84_058056 [Pisum sativum]
MYQLAEGGTAVGTGLNTVLGVYHHMQKNIGLNWIQLLADVAAAIDEEDVGKFNEVVKEFDGMIPFDSWKTKLNLRELEEDDLT